MKRWQWIIIGLALCASTLVLLLIFWPKVFECASRCATSIRGPREVTGSEDTEELSEAA